MHDIEGIIKEAKTIIQKNLKNNKDPSDEDIDQIITKVNEYLNTEYPSVPFKAMRLDSGEDKVNVILQSSFRLN